MNCETLAGIAIVTVLGVGTLLCFYRRPSDGGIVPASPPRSWHGYHYVDDATGRVIGTVQGYGDVWQATGDHTAVYIDEASARRAVEADLRTFGVKVDA